MRLPAWVRGTLLLAVTLAAGVALGVGYERRRTPAHGTAVMESHHVIHRLKDGLELDSAQQNAVAAILARRQGTVDSTWHALRPQLHAMMDSTLAEIAHILRPDQVVKYRKMVEGMHPGSRHLP